MHIWEMSLAEFKEFSNTHFIGNFHQSINYALIKAESNFNEKAVSHQNAKGLMQLMQSTAQDLANRSQIKLTKDNILDPDININLGTQYIASLLNKYDSLSLININYYLMTLILLY